MVALILASAVSAFPGAQSSIPLPEVTTLIGRTIQQQRFAESKEREYVFREETNDVRLRKECTWAPECPAPFGVPGVRGVAFSVTRYSERNFEIFWLDGVRVDRELAEAKALRTDGKAFVSPDDPPQIVLSRMLELCTFANARRETIDDRSTILLDFAWNASIKPASLDEALLKAVSGTVGIDEEDHAVEHVEGKFLADVKLEDGKIEIRRGTRVRIENRRVEPGIWLLSNLDTKGKGHYFTFAIDGDGHIFTGNYWRFGSTSRVLGGFAEVPANSGAPSPSNNPQTHAPSEKHEVAPSSAPHPNPYNSP